ncbi:hypothetical protein HDU99_009797 [Rhizoclosmatium hyalinum]|nr:hypothetical protein HDU99_009797 [Rhizoclosmatium hyalinum]
MNVLAASAVVACSLPMLPLRLFTVFHWFYRSHIRQVQAAYISFLLVLTSLMLPGSKFMLSGDVDGMRSNVKQVVIANHQIYPDWFYLFIFARFKKCHADVKVILIQILSRLPIFGQGMWFFEFIFMAQRFEKDKGNMAHYLTVAKRDTLNPLWLLLFPEGTLNTPGNIEKSKAFAKKMNINSHPNHCILPKSTGLFFSLNTLAPEVTDLFDLTVGYSGLDGTQIPYDAYLIDKVFFAKEYPREVHIHIEKYNAKRIPGVEVVDGGDVNTEKEEVKKAKFEEWLRGVWAEKDERLAKFYQKGLMSGRGGDDVKRIEIPLVPSAQDWITVSLFFGLGYLLTRVYISGIYVAISALSALIWG